MKYQDALDFAREAAQAGGRIALDLFRRDPAVKQKSDGTLMTEADWAAEQEIRRLIGQTWPDHNIMGEEAGLTRARGGPPVDGAPTWTIDPIDGTNNYIAGIPVWATLISLCEDDTSLLGVCHAPALGETYEALRGDGARMNYQPIGVEAIDDLGSGTVLSTGMEAFIDDGLERFYIDVVRRCGRSRGFGDFWGHMLVARGAAHVMIETEMWLWDYAPLQPIVEEAGGRITQLDGTPCAGGKSCLTTNGALHDDLVSSFFSSTHSPSDATEEKND
jgi:histidinol-phosphatase